MKRRLLAAGMAVSMAVSLAACGGKSVESGQTSAAEVVTEMETTTAGEPEEPGAAAGDGGSVEIQILATSDLHGKFAPYDYALNEESTSGSVAQVASAVKDFRNDNTLVIDVGDLIQDNSADLFLDDEIHPMVLGMNLIGYDVFVTGNHEYNYGMDVLKRVLARQKAEVLTGNVYDPAGEPLAKPYTIIEVDGVRVGIIGMVTPNITRWDSVNLKDWQVTDPVEETKKAIAELEGQTDLLIGAMHMGEKNEYGVDNSGVVDMAEACPELDLILAAHEHKLVEGTYVNDVLIVENKNSAQTMARINITLTKAADGSYEVAERSSESIDISQYEADFEVMAELSPYDERAREVANTVIGKLEGGDLAPANEIAGIPQAILEDTAMLDLINEVQMYYTDADVSAAALFIADSNLHEGDIKKSDVSLIYKYTNTLYKLEMTGAQLRTFMEWSAGFFNTYQEGDLTLSFDENIRMYNYDTFAGVSYEINVAGEPGSRIENLIKKDGTPVADDDIFIVAVNNYRAGTHLLNYGSVFKEGEALPVLLEIDVMGNIGGVRELIGDYIVNVKHGVITPECDKNWKIVGNDWDTEAHQKVVELVEEGKLAIPTSEDKRTPNVRSITIKDIENQ